EIDRLRGLPKQGEADRDQRIDRAGCQAGDEKLEDIGHHLGLSMRPARCFCSHPNSPLTGGQDPAVYLPSLGRILVIFCWPLTTSARKVIRSISPTLSHVVSIRIAGSSLGEMVSPCIAWAKALRSNLPSFFSVTYLTA